MRYQLLVLLAIGCVLAAGCARSGSKKGSKVTGAVTHNGKPVAGARITFCDGKDQSPQGSGPTAITDESGEYALVGVPAGSYKIVVYKMVAKKGAILPDENDLEQIEASGLGVHALPQKYSRPASTTLVAQVDDGDNKVDLKLTGQ